MLQVSRDLRSVRARGALWAFFLAAAPLCLNAAERAGELPATMIGTWDHSFDACGKSFEYSTTRLDITPTRLAFPYGYADIVDVFVSQSEDGPPVAFLRGDLIQEGHTEPGPEMAFYRLTHVNGTDMLVFSWRNGDRQQLVRCDPASEGSGDAAPNQTTSTHALTDPCGYYVLLGAATTQEKALALQESLGSVEVTGVIANDDLPGFRNGYHSVILGPFVTKAEADTRMAQWRERVPDTFVKNGCN